MSYYQQIKDRIIDTEATIRVKEYTKNRVMLENYYEIGRLIVEAQGGEKRAKYGDGLIKEYSKRLMLEIDKKYSERLLRRMRQFYVIFKEKNWPTLSAKLSWSHFDELLKIKSIESIKDTLRIIDKDNFFEF